jgi:DegV family protein with EDD domain
MQDIRQRLHVYAMLDTLEYVKKSGRISWARFRFASLMQIRPIIELRNGEIINQGEFRTRKKSIQQLGQLLRQISGLERLAILHTNAEAEAAAFREEFSQHSPDLSILCSVTPVIGTHVGPNAIGFAAVAHKIPEYF